jgi:hypothetical protein
VKSNSTPPQASRLVRPWEAAHARRMHPNLWNDLSRRYARVP